MDIYDKLRLILEEIDNEEVDENYRKGIIDVLRKAVDIELKKYRKRKINYIILKKILLTFKKYTVKENEMDTLDVCFKVNVPILEILKLYIHEYEIEKGTKSLLFADDVITALTEFEVHCENIAMGVNTSETKYTVLRTSLDELNEMKDILLQGLKKEPSAKLRKREIIS